MATRKTYLIPLLMHLLDLTEMKRLLLLLAGCIASHAADFEKTDWRSQLYVQVSPHDPWTMKGQSENRSSLSLAAEGIPVTGGILISPLITPFAKADIPFTVWIGGEVAGFRMGDLASSKFPVDSLDIDSTGSEKLTYQAYMPAVVAGFSVNLLGNLDLRLLGGYGQQRITFTEEVQGNDKYEYTAKAQQAFASAALEYRVASLGESTDLKLGLTVRKEFLALENMRAVQKYDERPDQITPHVYNDLEFSKITRDLPVQIGIEVSLDFGRESRRDRKVRFQLRDRTQVLRDNNKGRDTLSDWDCMAIERDYKFFLDNGELPDVRHKYTKAQFSDVLESFLAFCKPENLYTREKLYASLDSNKVELKRYQVSQEDNRYKQVMASNDLEMMKMFIQYYPSSPYVSNVQSKIKVLEDYKDFKDARNTNTFQSYLGYMTAHIDGHYLKEAETGIFELVRTSNRLRDYEIYLKKFPDGQYKDDARRALHELNKAGGGY